MANDLYDEAIIDVVGPETLLSKGYPIKVSSGFYYYRRAGLTSLRILYLAISLHGNLISPRHSDWSPLRNAEQKSTLSSCILILSSLHQAYPYHHLLR